VSRSLVVIKWQRGLSCETGNAARAGERRKGRDAGTCGQYVQGHGLTPVLLAPFADPFADTGEEALNAADQKNTEEKKAKVQQQNYIHIRIQQRNGRKTLTTLQGLPKGSS
jgi:hypothetical protein